MAILGKVLKRGFQLTQVVNRKKNPTKTQRKTLRKLISKACYTEFGVAYDFDSILKNLIFENDDSFYELFKKQVPVFDYSSMYEHWWHRTHAGEKNITWPGYVKYFALSSGTSEAASKHIPITKDMLKAIQKTSTRMILSLGQYQHLPEKLYEKGYLMLGGSTQLSEIDGHYEGDLSGITTGNIPFWFQRFYKPGDKISKTRDWGEKLSKITSKANEWDIGFVVGVPAWIQLLIEKIIKEYKVENIHQIWPNLEVFAHGGVSFEPYKQGFEKLLGRPITYMETYLASEGFIAYQKHPNTDMSLVLDNGIFFEFVPFDEQNFDDDGNLSPTPITLMINQVSEGKEYALLISTASGAWRYLIGDTIKFTNLKRSEIIITGRTKSFLSLCGEHLSVDNMNKAIELTSRELGIDIPEYTIVGRKQGDTFGHDWFVGTDTAIDVKIIQEILDKHLKQLNDDYAVERQHALKHMKVCVLKTQVFYDWMASKGKAGGQHKFPRVLKKATLIEDWEGFIK
jgi:hypothetical protein